VNLEDTLQSNMNSCITSTDLSAFGKTYKGKVRDTCITEDGYYILVTSDRISAFDHVLGEAIPFKGQVLNQTAAHFFNHTEDVIPNHIVSLPHPNVTIGKHCQPMSLEFVVRGYLAGHAWREYKKGERVLCGKDMPEGLRQNSRFPVPILTPSTKAEEGHDEDITREEAISQNLISQEDFDFLEEKSLKLFERGSEMARERGLILVDTKYEFGKLPDGSFIVIDEIHTPDSSRYFYADTYEELLEKDEPQRQLSKEFVREWLMENGFQGKDGQTMPTLPDEFRSKVSVRYIELYEAITGLKFEAPESTASVQDEIEKGLQRLRS